MQKNQAILSTAPIVLHAQEEFHSEHGAEASFLGIVRGTEESQQIRGIHYRAYEPMAVKELEALVQSGAGDHSVFIQHRLGPVAVGEPSVVIRVRSKHSATAFTQCARYLAELKQRVPIWKEVY